MTEDDTFRRLRRKSYEDVNLATTQLWIDCNNNAEEYLRRRPSVLSKYGWTLQDWIEGKKLNAPYRRSHFP